LLMAVGANGAKSNLFFRSGTVALGLTLYPVSSNA